MTVQNNLFTSCRSVHLSVIQEENEEISPSITLLRKPRFSSHFDKNIKKTLTPRGSISSSDVEHDVIKHKSDERRKSLRSRSRRSSESSLSSSSFKVLPPIPKLESEASEENDIQEDSNEGEKAENNQVEPKVKQTEEKDDEEQEKAKDLKSNEQADNTMSSDIETLVAKNLAMEGRLKSGKSSSER